MVVHVLCLSLFGGMIQFGWVCFGLSPLPVTVANEGLGWDPLLKM